VTNNIPIYVCNISAAHCFWNEAYGRTIDKDNFRISAGKFYRDWNIKDIEMQERQVREFSFGFQPSFCTKCVKL
jgi:hypothetical protein